MDETPPKQQNRDTTCRIVSGVNDKRYPPQALRPRMAESPKKKAPKRKPQKKKIAIFLHI